MDPIVIFFVIIIVVSVIISILYYSAINYNNNSSTPPVNYETPDPPPSKPLIPEPNNEKNKSIDISYNKTKKYPNDYIIIDVQTSGLDYDQDSILQITGVKYINGIEQDVFQSFCKYTRSIPTAAAAVNNISESMVKNAPTIRTVLNEFLNFIEDFTLIAYNAEFQMHFLQYNYGVKLRRTHLENGVIDALELARENLYFLPNHKLATVREHYNIPAETSRAMSNCAAVNKLYQSCYEKEQFRNKYIIPFSSDPYELNETEIKYIEKFVEICLNRKMKKSDLFLRRSNPYLLVERAGRPLLKCHFTGKLRYFLINISYDKFQEVHKTDVKCTAGSSNEVGMTRVFPTDPEQLKEFEDYIFSSKTKVWTT